MSYFQIVAGNSGKCTMKPVVIAVPVMDNWSFLM